jgi:flotillin
VEEKMGDYVVGIVIVVLVITIFLIAGLVAQRYKKVAPNEVLVISGRKHRIVDADGTARNIGHRIVKGGGTFVIPVVERVNTLSLNAMVVEVTAEDAYTKQGVPVIVDSVVVMKIGGDDVSISNAAERFLGFGDKEIKQVAQEVLGGHLRAICSTLSPEEINNNRVVFQQKVLEVAHPDFSNMGLVIDSFTVKQIRDKQGFFEALGKKSTAEVKRDAIIGEAEALQKDAVQQRTDAEREGAVTKANNEAQIASANKDRDVKIAQYQAEVEIQTAKAAQAGPRASAVARQEVIEAETNLQEKEALRREKELMATVIKPAEAKKTATIIEAEGAKLAAINKAEGDRQSKNLLAEANQYELEQEGKGQAAKIQNIGKAEGEASRAKGLGEAEAIEAKLSAEAKGLERRAEAMKKLNEASIGLEISKELIRTLPAIVEAATKPLASVQSLKIVDLGGSGGGGKGPIDKLLNVSPQALASLDETLKSTMGASLMDLLALARSGRLPSVLTEGDKDAESKPVIVEPQDKRPRK